jgi:hypothetical protein
MAKCDSKGEGGVKSATELGETPLVSCLSFWEFEKTLNWADWLYPTGKKIRS